MTNQSLAGPGKIVYDPFAGTGSLLLTSAAFGALTFGSDIDGRQLRGKCKLDKATLCLPRVLLTAGMHSASSIVDSAEQYGLTDRILDCAVFDLTVSPTAVRYQAKGLTYARANLATSVQDWRAL